MKHFFVCLILICTSLAWAEENPQETWPEQQSARSSAMPTYTANAHLSPLSTSVLGMGRQDAERHRESCGNRPLFGFNGF